MRKKSSVPATGRSDEEETSLNSYLLIWLAGEGVWANVLRTSQ